MNNNAIKGENNLMLKVAEVATEKKNIETMQPVVFSVTKEKPILVVCDVCGHANKEGTALCKMCSNYLRK